jgi:hypothetical protein
MSVSDIFYFCFRRSIRTLQMHRSAQTEYKKVERGRRRCGRPGERVERTRACGGGCPFLLSSALNASRDAYLCGTAQDSEETDIECRRQRMMCLDGRGGYVRATHGGCVQWTARIAQGSGYSLTRPEAQRVSPGPQGACAMGAQPSPGSPAAARAAGQLARLVGYHIRHPEHQHRAAEDVGANNVVPFQEEVGPLLGFGMQRAASPGDPTDRGAYLAETVLAPTIWQRSGCCS